MPRQPTILGRPVSRITTRQLTLLLFALAVLAVTLISALSFAVPPSPSLATIGHRTSRPHPGRISTQSFTDPNPSRQSFLPLPRQRNDTYAGASWWADWKWASVPFSSSFTLDDERVLLPPLSERPRIYCYYDATISKSSEERDAESEIMLTWRRAWWAQGFSPTILSLGEAMANPLYGELQRMDLDTDLEADLLRWLAWDTMGGGLLSHYTLVPMAPRQDPLISFLRQGKYPHLTRWKDLDSGLVMGAKADINVALRSILDPSMPKLVKSVAWAVPDDLLKTEDAQESLAYYSAAVIAKKYAKIANVAGQGRAEGLRSLNQLMNAHLHVIWQNSFSNGIQVLKPLPEHTTTMINGSLNLAFALASCTRSPMPSTCPPNQPRCTPCVAISTPMKVSTPARYHNSTRLYTVGTVPHPWTLALVNNLREALDIGWIRRESSRDAWLAAVTQDYLGAGVSGTRRIVRFKEMVAGNFATARALWLTAEREMPTDLDWHFGFAIPKTVSSNGRSRSPVPADWLPEEGDSPPKENGPVAPEEELVLEPSLLKRAKRVVALPKASDEAKLRTSLEAWNLADTEAWKFARAFQARQSMERIEWETEEERYSNGIGSEKGRNSWSRWLDAPDDDESDD